MQDLSYFRSYLNHVFELSKLCCIDTSKVSVGSIDLYFDIHKFLELLDNSANIRDLILLFASNSDLIARLNVFDYWQAVCFEIISYNVKSFAISSSSAII
jgi:hypothetical protein